MRALKWILSALIMSCLMFASCSNDTYAEVDQPGSELTDFSESSNIDATSANVTTEDKNMHATAEIKSPSNPNTTAFRLNQVGYLTNSVKRAIVIDGGTNFYVVEATTGEVKYSNKIEAGNEKVDKLSGDVVCYADFTDFNTPGFYYLYSDNGVFSYTFRIGDDVYDDLHADLLRMLYFQRCGTALEEEYAGEYAHAECHTYPTAYAYRESRDPDSDELSTSTDVHFDLTGGWHEAGDYSKQIASGVCAATLLLNSYRLYAEVFEENSNIPESSNGVPDILDEARWELEYLLKAQDKDSGGIYWTVFQWRHPPTSVLPQNDRQTYYAYKTALESTGMTCQLFGLASRIYKQYDADFASKCADAASRCWEYLEEHENDGWCRYYLGKYGYGNSMGYTAQDPKVTRYGAACEMYLNTGDEKYLKEIKNLMVQIGDLTDFYMHSMSGFATLSCVVGDAPNKLPDDVLGEMKQSFILAAKKINRMFESTAYEIPLNDFSECWTNQSMMRNAMIMIVAEMIDTSLDYSDAISNTMNYMLGQNAVNFSFISGYGTNSVKNFHTRVNNCRADGQNPIPGYVVFGPYNLKNMIQTANHDKILEYISEDTPDMKAYVDHFDLYRINEIEVDANSYPVFLVAYLRSKVK